MNCLRKDGVRYVCHFRQLKLKLKTKIKKYFKLAAYFIIKHNRQEQHGK